MFNMRPGEQAEATGRNADVVSVLLHRKKLDHIELGPRQGHGVYGCLDSD